MQPKLIIPLIIVVTVVLVVGVWFAVQKKY